MKRALYLAVVFIFLVSAGQSLAQTTVGRPMFQTYWHQLNGPYWIYKPLAISVEGTYIYTFGSDKESQSDIFVTSDGGQNWIPYDRSNQPPNCISASAADPQYAYYSSPNLNMFYTVNGGEDWNPYTTYPPPNTNFTVCAASPVNPSVIIAGCGNSDEHTTLEKSISPNLAWIPLSVEQSNYPVMDLAWSSTTENTFYVALDGTQGSCFYATSNGGGQFDNRSPTEAIDYIQSISVAQANGSEYIVVAGFGNGTWKLVWSNNGGQGWNTINLPTGFNGTKVRDLAVAGYGLSSPTFFMATDVGIFKYDDSQQEVWEDYYNYSSDDNVFSLGLAGNTVYAGTLHSFIKITDPQTFDRINAVMFLADTKSVWEQPSGSDVSYTLNTKTGAIFKMQLNFDRFNPLDDNPYIGFRESTLVANISGLDGEYDGLALAGNGDIILTSSKNAQGEGKVIEFDGQNWQEIFVSGRPAFEALAAGIDGLFAAFGGTTHNIYKDWQWIADWQTIKVNSFIVPLNGNDPGVCVLAGKRVDPSDPSNHFLAYSNDGGYTWE